MKGIIQVGTIAAMACAAFCHAEASTAAQTSNTSSLKTYKEKNYDHLIGNVPGLNDDLLKMHLKLYKGYVDNSNLLLQKLTALQAKGEMRSPEFAGLKRMLGWEMDGMRLHEYYFDSFGKSPLLADDHPLMKKIVSDWGSYSNWKSDFIATGLMRGIGWSVAYIDPSENRLINMWINEHDVGHLAGGNPIVIMDVFEHAYMPQYGLDRAKYIDVFFENLNWNEIAKRYKP